jgi:hypothetical protein
MERGISAEDIAKGFVETADRVITCIESCVEHGFPLSDSVERQPKAARACVGMKRHAVRLLKPSADSIGMHAPCANIRIGPA